MSPRTEHPPSTDDGQARAKTLRRAVIGGAAGVACWSGRSCWPTSSCRRRRQEGRGCRRIRDVAGRVPATPPWPTTLGPGPSRPCGPPRRRRPTTTTEPPPPTTEAPTTTTTEAPTTTEPGPVGDDSGGGFGDNSYATWGALADCESGGRWDYSAGPTTAACSSRCRRGIRRRHGLPVRALRETQIHFGQILQARSGSGPVAALLERAGAALTRSSAAG